jgi:LEA14-like dessication related protein
MPVSSAAGKTTIALLLGVLALLLVAVRPGFASGKLAATASSDATVTVVDHGALVPGRAVSMRVRVANPHPYALTVSRISTTLRTAAGCAASAADYTVSLRLPARGSTTVPVTVTLARGATNACQGARFAASFSLDAAA